MKKIFRNGTYTIIGPGSLEFDYFLEVIWGAGVSEYLLT